MSNKCLSAILAILNLACVALPAATPLGTVFTYQGLLQSSSSPLNGPCDFQFSLWDAPTLGSSIGSTQAVNGLSVSNGQLTVGLDFGPGVFNGDARWLEIAVRTPPGAGDFTRLAPRQPLTATPYALTAVQVPATNLIGRLTAEQMPTNATWLNLNQVFTGNNSFSGVSIMTNANNVFWGSFSGIFAGDGSGLTNVPSGGSSGASNQAMPWTVFSGAVWPTLPNHGYLAQGAAQSTFTLPAAPAVGDIIRVAGASVGGWKITQGAADQIILTQPLGCAGGYYWASNGPPGVWRAIASSADGTRLVAVANDHLICASTNSGRTWDTNNNPTTPYLQWSGVACSADGAKLVGGGSAGGSIYTSTDFGASWTEHKGKQVWKGFASSADGIKLVAIAENEYIYTSTDSGNSWSRHGTSNFWTCVACSTDGTRVVAGMFLGPIYVSVDSGVSYVPRGPTNIWTGVASSADGSRLVAVGRGANSGQQIFLSVDYGITWTNAGPTKTWTAVASSADGSRLFALEDGGGTGGQVYSSTDYGTTWSAHDPVQAWRCIATASSGGKVVAATAGDTTPGFIFTSVGTTTPGPSGGLMGGLDEAVELLYMGNNRFRVLSHEGSITSF